MRPGSARSTRAAVAGPAGKGVRLGGVVGFVVGGAAAVAVVVATGGIALAVAGAMVGGATAGGRLRGRRGARPWRSATSSIRSVWTPRWRASTTRTSSSPPKRRTGSPRSPTRNGAACCSQARTWPSPQAQRERLVRAAARHGYKVVSRWRAYAEELRQLTRDQAKQLDRVPDKDRKALLEVPEDQVPDRAALRALRKTLVFNVGKQARPRAHDGGEACLDAHRAGRGAAGASCRPGRPEAFGRGTRGRGVARTLRRGSGDGGPQGADRLARR